MKLTSPLSLLLFLQLTSTAVSLPLIYAHGVSNNGHTPSTRILLDPHFPPHQLDSSASQEEELIDNTPYTPTSHIPTSEALLADKPLSSSYLKKLANQIPPLDTTLDALPSKPTSALPNLRKEDAERYWGSRHDASEEDIKTTTPYHKEAGSDPESVYSVYFIRSKTASTSYVVREYSDVIVIGIVLFFFVIVLFLEGLERIGDLYVFRIYSASRLQKLQRLIVDSRRSIFTGTYRRRHGEIFLQDDEAVACVVKTPFKLQPAPPSKYKIQVESEKGFESEASHYDSDAAERV